jgi:hypothetical protein
VTDNALENAEHKRDSLAAEINSLAQKADDLKRELAKVEAWIAQWHQFADVRQAGLAPNQGAPQNERFPILKGVELPKIRRATGNPKKEEVAEATRQIILERGEPISRGDLFKALADRGLEIISESDPEMVLSTMLWRMQDQIVRLKSGGYWLAERPYAPAAYDPADAPANTKELLSAVLSAIDTTSMASQLRLSDDQTIPADIDRRMLAISKAKLRRNLTEGERRSLRKEFVKAMALGDGDDRR